MQKRTEKSGGKRERESEKYVYSVWLTGEDIDVNRITAIR
jgi:hypothetical protein